MSLASIRNKNRDTNSFSNTRNVNYTLSDKQIKQIKETVFDGFARGVNYKRLKSL